MLRNLKPRAILQAALAVLLVLAALLVLWVNNFGVREESFFGYALLAQSLPFLSAALLAR
jgi:hypothetical protein